MRNLSQASAYLILLAIDFSLSAIVYEAWPTNSIDEKIWAVVLLAGIAWFNVWCHKKIIKFI